MYVWIKILVKESVVSNVYSNDVDIESKVKDMIDNTYRLKEYTKTDGHYYIYDWNNNLIYDISKRHVRGC